MSVSSFQIKVPKKIAPGQQAITRVRAIISVENTSPITFQISDPRPTPDTQVRSVGPISPGNSPVPVFFDLGPTGSSNFDALTVTSPSMALHIKDPLLRRYEFYFQLNSDYDANANCTSIMTDDEFWTITKTVGPNITGVCLLSWDFKLPGGTCGADLRPIDPSAEPVAEVVGFPITSQPCQENRPGVDAVLVLDRSGSMGGSTTGSATETKIEALRNAVLDFVSVWNALRTSEPSAPIDNIGILLFNQDANWWSDIPNGLNSFDVQQADILANVGSISAGGSTSIGDGLILADGVLSAANPDRRRVILLMSDGKQNTDIRVAVMGGQVVTHTSANPANTSPLPNQLGYQIYSVTIGTGEAVEPQINEDLATNTQGFYINSEVNEVLLSSLFLELLQNFIHFNSWQTYKMVSGNVSQQESYTTSIRITSTTTYMVFNVRWPKNMSILRLSVTPPGEARSRVEVGQGNILMNFDVPTSPNYNYLDAWQVQIEVVGIKPGAAAIPVEQEVPFELVVIGEDSILDAEMEILPGDHVPGNQIQLQARLVEFGEPLVNLGDQDGSILTVSVVRPGVGIGDLLSSSTAPTNQPFADDPLTSAGAKLNNELQQNPGSLVRDSSDVIQLADNGDGIYKGSYPVETPGHYNFLFRLQGKTRNAGNFSRMQLKTAYVRPAPDPESTLVQTVIERGQEGNRLVITITPRTRFGHKLGPGWANYFWFKSSDHRAVKSKDNLDGSYSVGIPFNGIFPPQVAVHFLQISMILGDSVSEAELPVPLDSDNVLLLKVSRPGLALPLPWWLILLLILVVLFLIIWWLFNSWCCIPTP